MFHVKQFDIPLRCGTIGMEVMVMPNWTKEQLAAIKARNNTILVSAAAGSGKTAVLVERVVQLIREGWHIDRMLIVTFTRAAASEMRQRLEKRLIREAQGNPQVFGQALDDLESTEISTIHAFCQKALRNHFQAVGIDPMVRPCDDQLRKTLFAQSWLEAFDDLLEKREHEDFIELAYAYDQGKLQEMTEKLHDFIMSLDEPFGWLDNQIHQVGCKPYEASLWYRMLVQRAQIEIPGIGTILQGMKRLFKEPNAVSARMATWEKDWASFQVLQAADLTSPATILQAVASYEPARAATARGLNEDEKAWVKRFNREREKIGEILKETKENMTIDEERFDREFTMMRRHLQGLSALVRRTHEIFLEKKAENHVIDFSDMEQFTLQILKQEELRNQMRAEYDHIFVDECQDVSQVQDAILQALHHEGNILFMVGDVKQSIYRFRKADPTLFMHRLRTFSDDQDAKERRIILQKNFRSRGNVLEATNQVFRRAMRPNVTELTYDTRDELICGRQTEDDPPVEMYLVDENAGEDGENVSALEAEANVVIRRIQELLKEEFDDGEQRRKYTYRDMVILLSAAANTAPKLVELLSRAGIPVYYDGAAAFFDLPEIRAVKALLSVIDNPMQDIPLMAALKMPPFSLNDHQLASIRTAKTGKDVPFYDAFEAICAMETGNLPEKCREAQGILEKWRFEADVMRLSDFLWHILQESGYYASVGALPQGELRQANLRMLFQRAQDFEENIGGTLVDFLMLMDQQSAADDKMSAKMLGENENLLRIMTMHKSKGLEFPVVFCMQMSGRLHKAFGGDLLMHPKLGVALPYIDRELRIKRKTMANEAFSMQRLLDDKAERARLLYVAMTRARERLILIGSCKGVDDPTWKIPASDYAVWSATRMTDWLMQGASAEENSPWNVQVWAEPYGIEAEKKAVKWDISTEISSILNTSGNNQYSKWENKVTATASAPLKTSVSALAKQAASGILLPLTESEEDPETKRAEESALTPLRLSEIPSRPAFLEERRMTGAERGTLTHRLLSLIPLEGLKSGGKRDIQAAIGDMVNRQIFTQQEAKILDTAGISGFFGSEIGQRMLRSANIRREWAFNLLMEDHSGTILQGVIDCVFEENGGWVLIDYKTDRIEDEEEFIHRYTPQLTWYARALERITQKPVHEKWLYAITRRRAYRIP